VEEQGLSALAVNHTQSFFFLFRPSNST